MKFSKNFVASIITLTLFAVSVTAQDNKKYEKNGLSFEYQTGWEISEKLVNDTDEIGISNKEADAQITLMSVRKSIEGKDPVAEAKKRVVDPWLDSLLGRYVAAGVAYKRTDIKSQVGGMAVDGVEVAFFYDRQGGKLEAYWVLFDKKLILMYIIRPDRLAAKADPTWETVKSSIRFASKPTKVKV